MNKKINPALIGAFVLASMAMAIVALAYLGASSYGKDKAIYVAYFRTETSGLEVGAPVLLQGVRIGNVTGIDVGYESTGNRFYVKVEFVTRHRAVLLPADLHLDMDMDMDEDREMIIQTLIENGFRARLATQSMVTGKLMLELGFYPGTKVNLHTREKLEIPTIPNTIEKLWQQLAVMDLGKMGAGITNIVTGLDELVNNVELQRLQDEAVTTLKSLQVAVKEFRQMVSNLDEKVGLVANSVNRASDQVSSMVQNVDAQVDPLIQEIHRTIRSADNTLVVATNTLSEAGGLLSENSALRVELTQALQSISDAARALKGFADYLERHPEALLKGK